MERIFRSRPFKTRNADEYELDTILNLFVNPINGLSTPFDYENSIIKGRMGSGKTMFLRANHAYHISCLVPALMAGEKELTLPVFIKLNDFQHLHDPQEIYSAIIIKIIEELASIFIHLENKRNLSQIQKNIRALPENIVANHKFSLTMKELAKLGSEEFIERVSTDFGLKGGVKPKFFELSAEWKKNNLYELKQKPNPGMKDVEACYKNLLADQNGKILLLLDEAGSLDKSFFKAESEGNGIFEILMNQFRTSSFIRTKIAVYPHSYSDLLTETRYGDVVILEESVTDVKGYTRFRNKAVHLIENYINPNNDKDQPFRASDIFEISESEIYGDALEQIIYASGGNMRRLIHLFDMSMDSAFSEENMAVRVEKRHVINSLIKHVSNNENSLGVTEKELLDKIVSVCKSRSAFKFSFPNVPLYKITARSREYNIISIEQAGSGRSPTIYSFDFAYCVSKDIPTHRMNNSERINKDRSGAEGRWINRIATINDELIEHAQIPGKIEGEVIYYLKDKQHGFIKSDDNEDIFFSCEYLIDADRNKTLMVGKRVRFFPMDLDDGRMGVMIEVL